jgi:hypothetical protein
MILPFIVTMEPMLRDRSVDDLPDYYTNLRSDGINEAVRNFDDPENLAFFNAAVTSPNSRNFFIDFGDDEAWSGFDLEAHHFSRLIRSTGS